MSKDIEEIRHWKAVCERTYEIIKEEQQRIEQLEKEVEHQRKCKRKYRKIADNFLEENTKLKERVKELENILNPKIIKIEFCPLCNTENLNTYSNGNKCCAFC